MSFLALKKSKLQIFKANDFNPNISQVLGPET